MIRAAAEDDIPRILEIEREAISPPWSHGALLGEIYRERSLFAVAGESYPVTDGEKPRTAFAVNEAVNGFIILRQMGDEGELLQIAVDRAKRRRGTADLLIGAALQYAKDNELKSVYLEVRKSNEAAVALYKKHGFISVRQRKDYYSNPVEDAVVMVRDL